MPIPFVAIGAVIGAASLGSTVHSTIKTRKWKRIHDKALAHCRSVEFETKNKAEAFNQEAEDLGRLRVSGVEILQKAADFLKKAKVRHREFETLNAEIDDVALAHWADLHYAVLRSMGRGAAGIGGAAGAAGVTVAGLYTAAGLFGVASTGVRIATLSGAAANSARLAWLGGGALAVGGAGVAGGVARLALGANLVAAPIGIAAAAWGQWKAEQTKRNVESALRTFADAEAKMQGKITVMAAAQPRIAELKTSITEAQHVLERQLATSGVQRIEDAHRVYRLAKALATLLEQPVLTDEQKRILEE